MGDEALRKRQASWKQPLAEVATKSQPLRVSINCERENAQWLTTNEGPECAPLDDLEFRINAREEPGVKDSMRRSTSLGETEQNCTMRDATYTMPVAKQDSSHRGRWLSRHS